MQSTSRWPLPPATEKLPKPLKARSSLSALLLYDVVHTRVERIVTNSVCARFLPAVSWASSMPRLSPSSSGTKHLQKVQNARSRAVRVPGEPPAAPERAGEAWGTHTAWCCVFPCSRRSRATSACLRNVPSPVRLQRPIPRRRWSVGTDGTHCSPQVMGSFGTILLVLGMLLQHASSTNQVLLTPLAQPACTQRSPTADCGPWVAGGCPCCILP